MSEDEIDDLTPNNHAPFRRPARATGGLPQEYASDPAEARSFGAPVDSSTGYWNDADTAAADIYDYGSGVDDRDESPPSRDAGDAAESGPGGLVVPYQDDAGEGDTPRRRGAQRSLEEALVLWWSDGRLPARPVLRDGLLMLEAGQPMEDSHRSLLLRAALYHRRGMVTALKHQRDPDRTALILREALLDRAHPLLPDELVHLLHEDHAASEWRPILEAELLTATQSPDTTRSDLASAALDQLYLAAAPAVFTAQLNQQELDSLLRPHWIARILPILILFLFAVAVAWLIGRLVLPRQTETLVTIPAGQYTLLNPDESTRVVAISEFQLTMNEVTNAEYRRCEERGACPPPAVEKSATRSGYYRDPAFADYPVVNVEQAGASAYCRWINGRLPTESEWQIAAAYSPILERTYRFPWGDRFETGRANSAELAQGDTLQVGSYHPAGDSPYGVRDAAGNVAEWTMSAAADRPELFVVKGGSYLQEGRELQTHTRHLQDGADPQPWIGFRCAAVPWSWLPFKA